MNKAKKVPERTCVGCKKAKDKKELIRIVKNADGIKPDFTGKMSGRGAYVCKNEECLELLRKSKGLNRSFKCEVPNEVYQYIKEEIAKNNG